MTSRSLRASVRAPRATLPRITAGAPQAQDLTVAPKPAAPSRLGPNAATHLAPGGAEVDTGAPSPQELVEYQRDLCERTILFWDTLRKRANNAAHLEHGGAGELVPVEGCSARITCCHAPAGGMDASCCLHERDGRPAA